MDFVLDKAKAEEKKQRELEEARLTKVRDEARRAADQIREAKRVAQRRLEAQYAAQRTTQWQAALEADRIKNQEKAKLVAQEEARLEAQEVARFEARRKFLAEQAAEAAQREAERLAALPPQIPHLISLKWFDETLELINAYRKSLSLQPVLKRDDLTRNAAASAKESDFEKKRYIYQEQKQTGLFSRFVKTDELLAYDGENNQGAVEAWKKSEKHDAVLLDPRWNSAGVGISWQLHGDRYRICWSVQFGDTSWRPGMVKGRALIGTVGTADVTLPISAFSLHCLVLGKPGKGKTHLMLMLMAEHLASAVSVASLELKPATVQNLVGMADWVGIPPERMALFLPSRPDRVPGWNPLLEDAPAHGIAGNLSPMIVELASGEGTRYAKLSDMLANTLTILAVAKRSLYEVSSFLTNERFRNRLIAEAQVPEQDATAWRHAVAYFKQEYKAGEDISPIMNKIRPLIKLPFFEASFCAERNTFAVSDLWEQPQLMIAHLDQRAKGLGVTGAEIFGSIMTKRFLEEANRTPTGTQVLLAIDEVALIDRYLGGDLGRIIRYARQSGLRLLLAAQDVAPLSKELKDAALGLSEVLICFQLTDDDAKIIAPRLVRRAGSGDAAALYSELVQLPKHHCIVSLPGQPLVRVHTASYRAPEPADWDQRGGRVLSAQETAQMPGNRDRRIADLHSATPSSRARRLHDNANALQ